MANKKLQQHSMVKQLKQSSLTSNIYDLSTKMNTCLADDCHESKLAKLAKLIKSSIGMVFKGSHPPTRA